MPTKHYMTNRLDADKAAEVGFTLVLTHSGYPLSLCLDASLYLWQQSLAAFLQRHKLLQSCRLWHGFTNTFWKLH